MHIGTDNSVVKREGEAGMSGGGPKGAKWGYLQ